MPENTASDVPAIEGALRSVADEIGLCALGFATARPFDEAHRAIVERARLGYFGTMKFVMADPDRSCNPAVTMHDAKTIVSAALDYWQDDADEVEVGHGKVARYAWQDHYRLLRSKLETLAGVLRSHSYRATVISDSNALVDRVPAVRSSLGFYGKHANVITPSAGSWVVIGSILTNASLTPTTASLPSCGSCSLCLRRCPTNAIVSPGVVDSRRCIAYLLQSPGLIPMPFRRQVGNRLYGCDDCQECCPINRRSVASEPHETGPSVEQVHASISLREILSAPAATLAKRFQHFYMPRNDYDYLRRNALIALSNTRDEAYIEAVAQFLDHPRPMLRATAAWAVGEIGGSKCKRLLAARRAVETDDVTSYEIVLALQACAS